MDNYIEIQEEEIQPTVKTSIYNNGRSILFDVKGLSSYETSRLHEEMVQQAAQIRQQNRESQLITLIAFGQLLLFLICGAMFYGQLQRTEGGDNQQSSIQHQPGRTNRV